MIRRNTIINDRDGNPRSSGKCQSVFNVDVEVNNTTVDPLVIKIPLVVSIRFRLYVWSVERISWDQTLKAILRKNRLRGGNLRIIQDVRELPQNATRRILFTKSEVRSFPDQLDRLHPTALPDSI